MGLLFELYCPHPGLSKKYAPKLTAVGSFWGIRKEQPARGGVNVVAVEQRNGERDTFFEPWIKPCLKDRSFVRPNIFPVLFEIV